MDSGICPSRYVATTTTGFRVASTTGYAFTEAIEMELDGELQ